jgi:hypothetical protein
VRLAAGEDGVKQPTPTAESGLKIIKVQKFLQFPIFLGGIPPRALPASPVEVKIRTGINSYATIDIWHELCAQ